MSTAPPIPDLLALITADEVHRDSRSTRYSLFGVYNHIMVPSFPWAYPYFLIYMAFTDSQGKVPMVIRLVDGDELRPPIIESDIAVYFANPTHVAEVAWYAIDVVFPEPGDYRLQIWTGDILLGGKAFDCLARLQQWQNAPVLLGGMQ